MADALLVADQHVNEGFLAPGSSKSRPLEAEWIYSGQTLLGYGFYQRRDSREIRSVHDHLAEAHQALERLAQVEQRARRDRQFRQEMNWIAQNRRRFAGRWIALEGERLLASGATSREVFAEVEGREPPPLVIQIEDEGMPFAGW
jgi:hypothetical protein